MGSNPVNLAVRFILEIAGFRALGLWGWNAASGLSGVALALALPILAAVLWGTFAVPDDPSRSGRAPIPVPGIVRLALELIIFVLATVALLDIGQTTVGWTLGALVLIHYLASYDRVVWLVRR